MITMTELARLTGVSQPTVSRVLNGNTSVNPEVAQKVLACAKKYNYQPNMIARSLNGHRTCLLAVIVPDIANPFFADLIKSIENEASQKGYSLMIFNSDFDEEKEKKHLALLQQYRVDGLLLAPVHARQESIQPFFRLTIPWMIITNRLEGAASVYISHRKAGRMVARHLTAIGVEKYIFIGKRTDAKFTGFQEGLLEAGISVSDHLMVFWEKNREKMLELLTSHIKKSDGRFGIFALNDMAALVVMNALMREGIPVPQKAALVGFDNTFISRQVIPGITSISQPVREMGQFAVDTLLAYIENGKPETPLYKEMNAELVIRASTAAL